MSLQTKNNSENEFDTIIIGSGVGGLSAGICLSREGQKVLILEQHDVPGGWCHSFYLEGHRFTPGVHYIGQLDKGQSTAELYEGLGIANDLVFFRMNPEGYEHVHIGKDQFNFPDNLDALKLALIKKFPKEETNIKKYLDLIVKVNEQLQIVPNVKGFWEHLTIPFRTKEFGKYALFSLKRVIGWHIKDPLLKNILNIQYGDHGLPPSKAGFILHSAIMKHYFNGGYYPMGGGGALVKAMTKAIKNKEGIVRTKQNVKRILMHDNEKATAVGVELSDGSKVFAQNIISNADPHITYRDLVGEKYLSNKLKRKLSKTTYSCTSLMLFISVEMDLKNVGLDSGNIWVMPNKDIDDVHNEMMQPDLSSDEAFPTMFISCTTLKDPTSFNGKDHSIEAIVFIDYAPFKEFENEISQRTEKYLQFKEHLKNKMLKTVEKIVPGIRDHIVFSKLGTPITNDYYINSTNGSVYGTEKKLSQIGPFAYKSKSEIKNLYMCGASIVSHGVAGAGYSGVQTAGVILGKSQNELLAPDSSQQIKIYEAEDSSKYPEWLRKKIEVRKNKGSSSRLQSH